MTYRFRRWLRYRLAAYVFQNKDRAHRAVYGRPRERRKVCAVCSGPLDPSTDGGYVHLNDSDDTHTPVDPDFDNAKADRKSAQ